MAEHSDAADAAGVLIAALMAVVGRQPMTQQTRDACASALILSLAAMALPEDMQRALAERATALEADIAQRLERTT